MAHALTNGLLSVSRAAASSASQIDLACTGDEDDVGAPDTRLLRYVNGAWTPHVVRQHTASLCQFRDETGKASLLMMSRTGELTDFDGGGGSTKVIDARLSGKPYRLGHLSKLRQVDRGLYAVGAGGQVYRRDSNGSWRVLSEALLDGPHPDSTWILEYARNPTLLDDPEVKARYIERIQSEGPTLFWSVCGTSEASIYFGGEQAKGLLYFWDGLQVAQCKLPTEKAVRDMLVAPDGTVWVCGREGVLLRGRDMDFEVVADLGAEFRFASLAWFDQRLYIGASSGPNALSTFDGRDVQAVATGLTHEPEDAHTMEAVDGVLWSVGAKYLARFDGRNWEDVPVPGVSQP